MMVADASALVKLVVNEVNSDIVLDKFKSETDAAEPIYVPDIALAEASNALWKYSVLKKELADTDAALHDLFGLWHRLTIVKTEDVAVKAMKIAKESKIAFYDALYAAISIKENAPLLAFDGPLLEKAEKIGIKLAV